MLDREPAVATVVNRGAGQWQARVRRKGYPPVFKTFETKARAERWARMIESEIDAGVFVSRQEAESTTFGEALDRYLREVTPRKKHAAQEETRIHSIHWRGIFGPAVSSKSTNLSSGGYGK